MAMSSTYSIRENAICIVLYCIVLCVCVCVCVCVLDVLGLRPDTRVRRNTEHVHVVLPEVVQGLPGPP